MGFVWVKNSKLKQRGKVEQEEEEEKLMEEEREEKKKKEEPENEEGKQEEKVEEQVEEKEEGGEEEEWEAYASDCTASPMGELDEWNNCRPFHTNSRNASPWLK